MRIFYDGTGKGKRCADYRSQNPGVGSAVERSEAMIRLRLELPIAVDRL